ncbi:MAG: aminoacyl-tRNA hydrolase [Actinomycetales bacterium]|nr:aminoacyl-tRNA hydrolase [Actinomycetales bacterium]
MAWLIAGLGNPGPQYAATRHNIGFLVTDELARRTGSRLARHKRAHALAAEAKLGLPGANASVVLAEPQSFMNASGGPVKALMQFYGVEVAQLIVVHDELDIAFDAIRVKRGGGDGGHNGLKSIRQALGTGDFLRVRAGIGRPPGRQDPADFVLSPFGSGERAQVPLLVDRAADAVESLVFNGLAATQNAFNADPPA